MGKQAHTGQKRTQKDYTLGFKLSVVAQVEKGEMTYKQAQEHYGIQGRSTVLFWLRKHGTIDWKNLSRESNAHAKNLILNTLVDTIEKQ